MRHTFCKQSGLCVCVGIVVLGVLVTSGLYAKYVIGFGRIALQEQSTLWITGPTSVVGETSSTVVIVLVNHVHCSLQMKYARLLSEIWL